MTNEPSRNAVSFIIPVLNGEKYIGKAIGHIMAEMTGNDELIVVDNGSTDGTLDIVRSYGKATILQFPESTIAYLRNRGAEVATGNMFAFIDSDCLVCEGWRDAVDEVMSDEAIHASGSRYDIPEPPHWIEKAWYSKRVRVMTPINYINSGNLVVRREAFKAISGFDESLITDEDYDFGQRLNQNDYRIVEAPQIRAVHLGNPKSLWNFYRKEKWHATSSLTSLTRGKVDKPTVMTLVFLLCCVIALLTLPSILMGKLSPLRVLGLLLFVPVLTAVYRAIQYETIRPFPALVVLYFVFYVARGITFVQFLYRLVFSRRDSDLSGPPSA
jgi:glycosyltransferase involved in cell wall biosynthesis